MLATVKEKLGNWQEAEELCRKALQVEPDYPYAANNLAFSMLKHGGNVDLALSLAQTARRGLPNDPNVAGTLAWAYYYKGVYKTSIQLLEEAVTKAPGSYTLHYHLGLAYLKANDRTHAKQHLERALLIDPKDAQAGEIKSALAILRKG